MKSVVVIFANSVSEIEWAIAYNQHNPHQDVKIITPHFTLREKLEAAGLPANNYFLKEYFHSNFYIDDFQKLISVSKKIVERLKLLGKHILIENTIYLDLLYITLEMEFTAILSSYNYLQCIRKKWNPSIFYISQDTGKGLVGWDGKEFVTPYLYKEFFLTKAELKLFSPAKKFSITFPTLLPLNLYIKKCIYALRNTVYRQSLNKQGKQRKVDLLLFSAGLHLYYYHKVFPKLNQDYCIQIVAGSQSPEDEYLLHTTGIKFVPLQSFWSSIEEKKKEQRTSFIYQQLDKFIALLKKKSRLSEFISSEVEKSIIFRLEQVVKSYLQKNVKNTLLAKKAISYFNPRFVITTHDPGPSAVPFVFEAKKKDKKTLVLLHGWNDLTLGADHYSDFLIAWGSYTVSWFQRVLKKKKSKVFSGGFPLLDDISKQENSVKTQKPLPESIIFSLLLTLYPLHTYFQSFFLEELFDEAEKNHFTGQFWIRVHRGQSVPELRILAQKYSFHIEISPIESLIEFVQKSDIVLSWDTTALYYPMMFHKPLFYTTPLWGEGITPVKEYNAAWIPHSAKDVFRVLNDLKRDPSLLESLQDGQKRMLREVAGVGKGEISEKIANALRRIIN